MCGLGLVGGPALAGGVSELSVDAGVSSGDVSSPRLGEAGAWERVGLIVGWGAGLVGGVGVVLRCGEEEGDEEEGVKDNNDDEEGVPGVPGEFRAPGDTEKVVGVLRPNLVSSSVHTAKLRLPPSGPNPETPAASEPFANSWQRSTKLPRRIDPPHSRCLGGRGLEL